MPTLYHFFGGKQGLIEAVIERGFDLYLGRKERAEETALFAAWARRLASHTSGDGGAQRR
ncbi:hypothetical protein [Microbacterium sp. SORGH_AS_0888]|uniref:hypothetical protein n=1 Tax=Microbacterium sp. SORGH_AS_0888 TaxID=3041791 RepID=UPI0027D790AC|nr:hypothetical protein [Microbacterium sp. SORGH_AS_0888]